jgi:glycerophosphoryl diester phosphodiesterase
MKKYLTIFCLLAGLSACVPQQQQLSPNPYLIEKDGRPWVIVHGGAKALFPENTMVAFEGVQTYRPDALEMDVCLTRDDILVTHHDLTIDDESDGSGTLRDFSYEELQAFNFGHNFQDLDGNYPYRDQAVRIPKLEEVFERYGDMPMVVELKNRGENGKRAAEVLKALIEEYQMEERIIVASFSDEVLSHFFDITEGAIATSTSEEETKDFVFTGLSAVDMLYRPDASVIQIPTKNSGIALDNRRLIRAAHRRKMAVHYWTINDPEEMRELIELGADGLITDRPDLMWEVLEEMGF